MTPDPEVWCQARQPRTDGAWYRRGDARQRQAYYIATCEQCNHEFLGKKGARFCSRGCAVRNRIERPAEIPDWIDASIWRPGSGGTWYKWGDKHPHVIKICTRCGADYLGLRVARFCSVLCASGGDGKSYQYAHKWVRLKKGRASDQACVGCGGQATDWSYDGLDPDELVEPESGMRYSFDPGHYQPRCHLCHANFDGHFGEGNGRAKLTDAQCHDIQLIVGATQQELADRYDVTQGHISRIRRGKRSGALVRKGAS
jgi:hypothetical protein